ncbi:MAG: division/cell wall cluster transcriptional repressor MraZ [Bacteroidaceae bacterium]|nr:division/cell wall cluster transcriptional repressor MraZ [Bacteroidaceae bacterium]MBQ9169852.1 division/cell wall cluster transcriptional repressor MraZ [Bacteroidaceae bacterium]MBQ9171470.1 division/cell wall cluster transcriptional repressor MraZ [Bacteroidaceae bacterium]MBQ9295434.1 division/cell wall cluster transcriptional repressor MraZ [Bacteroidaceae bacterium]
MRFTGSIDAKTDEKGRVFVPSVFRKILQKEEEEGLVLRRDLFVNCLVLYPKSVWDAQVDTIRARTNLFNRQQREALRLFTADAENVTLDSGGRMLIPRRYLEHAGIKSDVRFIGVDDTIEIWSKSAAEDLLSDPEKVGSILEEMMNPTDPH